MVTIESSSLGLKQSLCQKLDRQATRGLAMIFIILFTSIMQVIVRQNGAERTKLGVLCRPCRIVKPQFLLHNHEILSAPGNDV